MWPCYFVCVRIAYCINFTLIEAGASIFIVKLSGQADQASNMGLYFFTIGKDPGLQWRQVSIGTLLYIGVNTVL